MTRRTQLSEENIVAVLGRAAQIDAEGRGATTEDLVEWAREAGISAAAVNAAITELEAPAPGRIRRFTQGVAAIAAGAGGFIAGTFVRIVAADPLVVDRGLNAISPVAVAIAVIGALAMSKSRPVRERFQMLNALVWGCYISGWSIANGVATEDIMLLGIAAGIATSIAGGLAIYVSEHHLTDLRRDGEAVTHTPD